MPVAIQKKTSTKQGRKSCLKNPSFEVQAIKPKERQARCSNFDMLTRKSIDGPIIKNRKKSN